MKTKEFKVKIVYVAERRDIGDLSKDLEAHHVQEAIVSGIRNASVEVEELREYPVPAPVPPAVGWVADGTSKTHRSAEN